jgi:hypothetical protein
LQRTVLENRCGAGRAHSLRPIMMTASRLSPVTSLTLVTGAGAAAEIQSVSCSSAE